MRDWSELPLDGLSVVFSKLGAAGILTGAGIVCRSWLHAAKLPHLYRRVIMLKYVGWAVRAVAMKAVDRAEGRLEVFKGNDFACSD
uniref:F-box domain-containing protein n=1 Tax=Oryza barthii TaxID=65489 RepID=A0A0D3GBD7_9ORYZ